MIDAARCVLHDVLHVICSAFMELVFVRFTVGALGHHHVRIPFAYSTVSHPAVSHCRGTPKRCLHTSEFPSLQTGTFCLRTPQTRYSEISFQSLKLMVHFTTLAEAARRQKAQKTVRFTLVLEGVY
jgi:hypothetical protein